jgi:hypothetical protein
VLFPHLTRTNRTLRLSGLLIAVVSLGAWFYPSWEVVIDGERETCWPAVIVFIPHDPGGSEGHDRRAYEACSDLLFRREFPVAAAITGVSIVLLLASGRGWKPPVPPRPDWG